MSSKKGGAVLRPCLIVLIPLVVQKSLQTRYLIQKQRNILARMRNEILISSRPTTQIKISLLPVCATRYDTISTKKLTTFNKRNPRARGGRITTLSHFSEIFGEEWLVHRLFKPLVSLRCPYFLGVLRALCVQAFAARNRNGLPHHHHHLVHRPGRLRPLTGLPFSVTDLTPFSTPFGLDTLML